MKEKRITFEEIRVNNFKSTFLILFFLGLAAGLGALIGAIWVDNIWFGVILAVIVGGIYAIIAYYNGQKMIMSMMKGKEASRLEYPHLVNAVEGLAIAAGVPTPKIFVIKETAKNAFATGRDPKHAAIAVTTGLLEALDRDELEGVIAHEMAHIKHQDIKTMMIAAVIAGVIVLLADIMLRSVLWGGGSRKGKGNIVLLVVGIVLAILSPIIAESIRLAISRKREYAADAGGAQFTRYPQGLANALKKIKDDPDPLVDDANRATAHLFISTPFRKKKGIFTRMFATHPPIDERIARLEAM